VAKRVCVSLPASMTVGTPRRPMLRAKHNPAA